MKKIISILILGMVIFSCQTIPKNEAPIPLDNPSPLVVVYHGFDSYSSLFDFKKAVLVKYNASEWYIYFSDANPKDFLAVLVKK